MRRRIHLPVIVVVIAVLAVVAVGVYFALEGEEEAGNEATSAEFEVSNLVVNPGEVEVGNPVTISATVKNTGDLEGTYTVELKIDGVSEATTNVTLAGGATETVSFTVTKDTSGTYIIGVDGLQRSLSVLEPATFEVTNLSISPTQVEPGESIGISVNIKNEGDISGTYTVTLRIDGITESTQDVTLAGGENRTVSFTVTKDEAKSYSVSVDDLSGIFTVAKAVEIQNSSSYLTPFSAHYAHVVVGEVVNKSSTFVTDIEVTATFFDSDGNMVAVERETITRDWWDSIVLPPGYTAPFDIRVIEEGVVELISSYSLSVTSSKAASKTQSLMITSSNIVMAYHNQTYHTKEWNVVGTLKNEGAEEATDTHVMAALYDQFGTVVCVLGKYGTQPGDVPSGGTANFSLEGGDKGIPDDITVVSVTLFAESDQSIILY